MTGAKFEPVENNYTGCQQLQRLFQHTPMLQQTVRHAQISHKSKRKSKEILNLRRVCWISASWNVNRLLSPALYPCCIMHSDTAESLSWTYYIWIRRRVFAEAEPGESR